MTLKQLYDEKKDVKQSYIPEKWQLSFREFMFGQTCAIEHKEDGTIEFVTYYHDFVRWYEQNQIQIERDITIDTILK
jgi:hypothetical protein